MKKSFYSTLLLFLCLTFSLYAQKEDSLKQINKLLEMSEFVSKLKFQQGIVDLSDKIQLNIPKGYKLISQKDSEKILFDYWGNPERPGILGMLVLNNYQILDEKSWAFVVTTEEEGFVKDEDAADLDYDQMLEDIKESEETENEERIKQGFEAVNTVGWASKPFYDAKANVLHWAKELKFGEGGENTLNYDIRILGREGLLSLNAVGGMSVLDSVKKHIPEILQVAKFKEGHRYIDFDPEVDKVAAYTIGGLVAGKLLAKAGLLALLLKNIKLLILGSLGLFSVFKNRIFSLFSKKREEISSENSNQESSEDPEK